MTDICANLRKVDVGDILKPRIIKHWGKVTISRSYYENIFRRSQVLKVG